MKAVIIGPAYPYRGGIATFNERLAAELVKCGHEVEIVTFTLQYPGFLFPGKTQYSDAAPPKGLSIKRIINSCNPLTWFSAARAIRRATPDLVIFAYWMSFFAPAYGAVARLLGHGKRASHSSLLTPHCLQANGLPRKVAIVHNMIPHEPNILDKLLPGYFIKRMDRCIALSHKVKDDILKVTEGRVEVAVSPHPLYDHYGPVEPREVAAERLGLDAECRYVLFFGLIRKYKGLDMLIDALADSRLAQLRSLRLIVAGECYGDIGEYKALAQSKGMADRIIWHDRFIPDAQVKDFFNASDLLVLPYRDATQSGVTQIGYHFGKPMVVTAVGALAQTVPDGVAGYVVKPEPEAIAGAIADFYASADPHRFDAGLAQQKSALGWDKMVQAIIGH